MIKYTIKKFASSSKPDFLYGINSIEVALHARKRNFEQLFISDSEALNMGAKLKKIILNAQGLSIPVTYVDKHKLTVMVKGQLHQNVVLKCSGLKGLPAEQAPFYKEGLYVFCDKITDPQNFGAILRSCLYFGVKAIFSSQKNSCPLNSTVMKVSSGALQLMDIYHIKKQQFYLQQWIEDGGIVISTTVSEHAVKPISLKSFDKLEKQKVILIIGSEGAGVSDHLARHAQYNLSIERTGTSSYPYNLIDSLNVNAALTCLLYQLTKKK